MILSHLRTLALTIGRRGSLIDPLPFLAVNDISNRLSTDAHFLCQRAVSSTACCIARANKVHVFLGQFSIVMLFSTARTSFATHISHISGMVAKKPMSRVIARRIITRVKNMLTFRYRTKIQFPSETMSQDHSSPIVELSMASLFFTVKGVSTSLPWVTFIWSSGAVNMGFIPFGRRSRDADKGDLVKVSVFSPARIMHAAPTTLILFLNTIFHTAKPLFCHHWSVPLFIPMVAVWA
jgi:hypothetical protein